MNPKKRQRLNFLNTIVIVTFTFAIVFSLFDIKISFILMGFAFGASVLTLIIKEFWSQIKQPKKNKNGR